MYHLLAFLICVHNSNEQQYNVQILVIIITYFLLFFFSFCLRFSRIRFYSIIVIQNREKMHQSTRNFHLFSFVSLPIDQLLIARKIWWFFSFFKIIIAKTIRTPHFASFQSLKKTLPRVLSWDMKQVFFYFNDK